MYTPSMFSAVRSLEPRHQTYETEQDYFAYAAHEAATKARARRRARLLAAVPFRTHRIARVALVFALIAVAIGAGHVL
jgi:hypothetical protein